MRVDGLETRRWNSTKSAFADSASLNARCAGLVHGPDPSPGLHALGEIVRRSRGEGTRVILSDVHSQPMAALGRSRLLDELGDENLLGSLDDALAAARAHLGLPPEP